MMHLCCILWPLLLPSCASLCVFISEKKHWGFLNSSHFVISKSQTHLSGKRWDGRAKVMPQQVKKKSKKLLCHEIRRQVLWESKRESEIMARVNDRGEKTTEDRHNQAIEALCWVGKVVYCSVALPCINYRSRNDKLHGAAKIRQTQRQTDGELTLQTDVGHCSI